MTIEPSLYSLLCVVCETLPKIKNYKKQSDGQAHDGDDRAARIREGAAGSADVRQRWRRVVREARGESSRDGEDCREEPPTLGQQSVLAVPRRLHVGSDPQVATGVRSVDEAAVLPDVGGRRGGDRVQRGVCEKAQTRISGRRNLHGDGNRYAVWFRFIIIIIIIFMQIFRARSKRRAASRWSDSICRRRRRSRSMRWRRSNRPTFK